MHQWSGKGITRRLLFITLLSMGDKTGVFEQTARMIW
jgi:hypothetical protein